MELSSVVMVPSTTCLPQEEVVPVMEMDPEGMGSHESGIQESGLHTLLGLVRNARRGAFSGLLQEMLGREGRKVSAVFINPFDKQNISLSCLATSPEGHTIQSGMERPASSVCAGKREAEIAGISSLCRYGCP